MSNYVIGTSFGAKDALPSGDPDKIIKGTEIGNEFTAIATAVNSKANSENAVLTGNPTAPTQPLNDNSTKIANTAFVVREINDAVAAGTEGLDGSSYLQVSCFQRSATAPSTPTGGSFNFTGLTLSAPTGWYPDIPSGSDPVYKSTALASTVGTTGLDDSLSWSTPVLAFQNGADGSGTDTISANGYLYYSVSSSTAPTAPTTSDTNTYVFATNTFTVIKTGWSTRFSAPSMTSGNKFWAVDYYVEEDENGAQTVTIGSTPFNWVNHDGLVTFTNFQSTFDSGVTAIDGGKITTGTLSASKITSGTMSADRISGGTVIGSTLKTASTGARIEINASNNKLQGFNSSGDSILELGGSSGSVYATATGGAAAIYGNGGSNFGGYFISSSSVAACQGVNSSGVGVSGSGSASPNAHGMRGISTYSTSTSGIVGGANGYDFYADGAGTNYGPFTGTHDSLVTKGDVFEVGDIVIDNLIVERNGISSTISHVVLSSSPNQKATVGVVCALPSSLANQAPAVYIDNISVVDKETVTTMKASFADAVANYDFMPINSLGEGQINVCGEGGNIEAGDLIVSSSIPGKGMKQADDIVRGYTVAKAREAVTFTSATEVKQIACIYIAG